MMHYTTVHSESGCFDRNLAFHIQWDICKFQLFTPLIHPIFHILLSIGVYITYFWKHKWCMTNYLRNKIVEHLRQTCSPLVISSSLKIWLLVHFLFTPKAIMWLLYLQICFIQNLLIKHVVCLSTLHLLPQAAFGNFLVKIGMP